MQRAMETDGKVLARQSGRSAIESQRSRLSSCIDGFDVRCVVYHGDDRVGMKASLECKIG